MRRSRIVATVSVALIALWAMTLPAASAVSTVRIVNDLTGLVLACGESSYTVTSGHAIETLHDSTAASGNANATDSVSFQGVTAVDAQGVVYSIHGFELFHATHNVQSGADNYEADFRAKLQVVDVGTGTVDNVNVTVHLVVVNGNLVVFDLGTCLAP